MTATPIVLLHAFPLDHRMWDDVARGLAGPVLAADLPFAPGEADLSVTITRRGEGARTVVSAPVTLLGDSP